MTPEVIDYKIINGNWYWFKAPNDKHSLDEEVAKAMKEGWQPLGGPVLVIPAKRKMTPMLSQAMVKYAHKRAARSD